MEENKFYSDLRCLLNEQYILNEDEPVDDQGAPVDEQNPEAGAEEQDYNDQGMQDADYMQDPGYQEKAVEEPQITDQLKISKLFSHFVDLKQMTTEFKDRLEGLNFNLFDDKKIGIIKTVLDTSEKLIEKISDYITDNFTNNKYEQNLYIYLLLRSELVTMISLFRKSLNLGRTKN